jgi:hypothetical protein
MWLPASASVVGEKTAREAVFWRMSSTEDGTMAIILWRGAKGWERMVREATRFFGTR